jgi:Putative binding domain, N-terminal/Viral BACON domain
MRTTSMVWLALSVGALYGATAGCEAKKSPVAPSPECSLTISPASQSLTDEGGTAVVTVTTEAGCPWSATSSTEWIAISSGRSGAGPGSVTYAVAPNTSAEARSGAVAVDDQRHTVSQSGRAVTVCTFEIDPQAAEFNKDAATADFAIMAPAGCGWSAASTASWLSIVGGGEGAGTGRVSYSVARNTGIEARTAAISIADKRFRVRQAGDTGICQYEVGPVEFTPCMAAGTLTAAITTEATCPWTVSATAPWLTVQSGTSGAGSAALRFAFTENYEAPRESVLQVRWPTPTAGQNIRVMQAGCRYAVSQSQIAVGSTGGTAAFDVIQQSEPAICGGATQDRCVWSARSDADWISVTTSMPRRGDDRVVFTVAANQASTSRVGQIVVRNKAVTITQPGR